MTNPRIWPPVAPGSLPELRAFVGTWSDRIFVREQIEGQWETVALSELPTGRVKEITNRFVDEGRIPVVAKPDDGE